MKTFILLPFVAVVTKIMVYFMLLFVVESLVIADEASKHREDSKRVAEVLITMTWDPKRKEDIDLWVQQPDGKRIYYSNRESTVGHLERDDRGYDTDVYVTPSGETKILEDNTENYVLRQLMPGEYIVNVYYFARHDDSYKPADKPKTPEVEVTITMDKMNPSLKRIIAVKRMMPDSKIEQTAFRFTVNPVGELTEVNEIPAVVANPGGLTDSSPSNTHGLDSSGMGTH